MTEQELKHFGIQGMKWGIRRYGSALNRAGVNNYKHPILVGRAAKLENKEVKSFVTRIRRNTIGLTTQEIESLNSRVNMLLDSKRTSKIAKFTKLLDKDINSFDPFIKTGIKNKNGKMLLSPEDVVGCRSALVAARDAGIAKITRKYKHT